MQILLTRIETGIEHCVEHLKLFNQYEALWKNDREESLQQFLTYGRELIPEEMEAIETSSPLLATEEMRSVANPTPPTLDQFKERIDSFEVLYTEVSILRSPLIPSGN